MIASAVLFALMLGALTFILLPSGRTWQRAVAASLFVLLVGVVYAGSIEFLGRPKPIRLEWRNVAEAEVLGSSIRENEAIYVWLQSDEDPEPRVYALPWSMEAAQGLQAAMEESEANGAGVQMKMAAQPGLDDREPRFYALPQPALPDKDYSAGPLASGIDWQQSDTTGR